MYEACCDSEVVILAEMPDNMRLTDICVHCSQKHLDNLKLGATNSMVYHVRRQNDETHELRERHAQNPERLRADQPADLQDGVRVVEPTDTIVGTKLTCGVQNMGYE